MLGAERQQREGVRDRERSEEVADFLEQAAPRLAELQDRFTVELYGFDPELAPVTPETLKTPARNQTPCPLPALVPVMVTPPLPPSTWGVSRL